MGSGSLKKYMKKATKIFSDAFCEFPSSTNVAYFGPQNAGPATLFYEKPTRYNSSMTCYAYDDLVAWRSARPGWLFSRFSISEKVINCNYLLEKYRNYLAMHEL